MELHWLLADNRQWQTCYSFMHHGVQILRCGCCCQHLTTADSISLRGWYGIARYSTVRCNYQLHSSLLCYHIRNPPVDYKDFNNTVTA
ncbi:hypothetical protein CEXT_375891 [Caerostris extrusa]|uniref:Uncharacterized protein n=1 Tax=Caerostris extrusa TaxID=172846 RepID=A0AAV4VU25_CAEEX|nr:hypothetical protein CEXT_375891 [Caerostris extrusa]